MAAIPRRRFFSVATCGLGAMAVAAFAPFGWFPLAWLAWAGFYLFVSRADSPREAGWLGFTFGFGHFLAGVSWVYVSLHDFGGMALPMAALASALLCAYLGLFPALAAWGLGRLKRRGLGPWALVFAFAGLWTLTEWARGWFLTGFPWLSLGYSQTPPSPLAGFAPVLGVYGMGLVTALLAACAAEVVASRRWAMVLPVILLLGGGYGLTRVPWVHPVGAPVRVALLQGDIAQDMKWQPERFYDSLESYLRLVLENPAKLTVLPETALPAYYQQLPPEFLSDLRDLVHRQKGDVLVGVVFGDGERYTNSAVSLGAAPMQRYDKAHLVPFGEYIPPGFAWFLDMMHMPMSNFTPGQVGRPPLALAGQQVAPDICYEDGFGEEIRQALPRATLLVNMSNTAWFGRSLAQPQHLQISRLRAMENGRPMLRATNTGMTAIITPDGRVQDQLPPFTRGALVGDVQGYQDLTPYARWGNMLMLVLAVLCLVPALLGRGPRAPGASR